MSNPGHHSIDLSPFKGKVRLIEADGVCRLASTDSKYSLPFAPSQGPLVEEMIGSTAVWQGSFEDAAFVQLVRFYFWNEGVLSRYLDYDHLLSDTSVPVRPREVSFILTKLCNLRCLHCYNDSGLKQPDELTGEEKLRLVEFLGRWGITILTLTGGEPTIDPVFPQVLQLARKYGMGVKVSTAAWKLGTPLMEAIHAGTVIQLNVSLDGADAITHDYLRHRTGSFSHVIQSLRELQSCLPKTLVLNISIHKRSLPQMEQLARMAAEYHATVVSFKPITFTGRSSGDRSFLLDQEDLRAFKNERDHLRRVYAGQMEVDGKLNGKSILPELQETLHCQAAIRAMVVGADGRMLPCDTIAGVPNAPNCRDHSPMRVWQEHPVFNWFRTIRAGCTGTCDTSGCPGNKASRLLSPGLASAFIPLSPV